MALSKEQAVERAERLRISQRTQRSYHGSVWAVNMAYAHGRQWQFVRNQLGGGRRVYQLREIIDPRRTDVRVTLDIIRPIIERTVAASSPQKLVAQAIAKTGRRESQSAKHVYDALLELKLPAIKALEMWRSLQWPRAVLGTVCVRRTIRNLGKEVALPASDKEGKQLSLRHLSVGWAKIMPWEILRSPSVRDFDPDIADVEIGQEKPRTLQWVKRNFGKELQSQATLGQMMQFQDQLIKVSGWGNRYMHSSHSDQVPAVMVYEFYFKDADQEELWPWQLIAHSKDKPNGDGTELIPLRFGKNPFSSLPFHFIYYSKPVQGPWGDGLPQLLKSVQDITNLFVTNEVRTSISHAHPKWLVQQGTVDEPAKVFTNRADTPIIWQNPGANASKPERVEPSQGPSSNKEMIALAQERAIRQANLAEIQFGEQVKRGQSGQAYEAVGAQADAVPESRRIDDQLVLDALILGTLRDEQRLKKERPDIVAKLLKDRFPRRQIMAAMAVDPARHISAVKVIPDTLRPKTPRQVRETFESAVASQILTADKAQWEMELRGVTLNSAISGAIRRQQLEIQAIIDGQEAPIDAAEGIEAHNASIQVLAAFFGSERRYTINDEQADALTQHWARHMQAKQELIAFEAQGLGLEGPQPGIASQPSQQSPRQSGAVEPANVA